MKSTPTGIAHAIWFGVGIVLISLIGLTCACVRVINLFPRSSAH